MINLEFFAAKICVAFFSRKANQRRPIRLLARELEQQTWIGIKFVHDFKQTLLVVVIRTCSIAGHKENGHETGQYSNFKQPKAD